MLFQSDKKKNDVDTISQTIPNQYFKYFIFTENNMYIIQTYKQIYIYILPISYTIIPMEHIIANSSRAKWKVA
jgi:hypothetical protein